jgi:hypothetical protein
MKIEQNIYGYGKFYDAGKERTPSLDSEYELIIYAQISSEISRTIGSLEGFFISNVPLIREGDKGVRKDWNPVIKRKHMEEFEKKYHGKFIPFELK